MICTKKHTKYQPTDEEWKCPLCGSYDLVLDSETNNELTDCDKLHPSDTIYCEDCDYVENADHFTKRLVKNKNICVCPTCNGKGFIVKK